LKLLDKLFDNYEHKCPSIYACECEPAFKAGFEAALKEICKEALKQAVDKGSITEISIQKFLALGEEEVE